ncbi:hypothetical protein GPALN_006333 [Globodera pallida]|nr:hypothetical protein GPALN_006333 [Globodera pallida]
MKLSRIQTILLNISGALYTILTISGIAILNLYFTCPDLCDDCYWPAMYALFILSQIGVNLLLFHYYNKRNQVQFWTAKSSWFFGRQSLEKKADIALNGAVVDNAFSTRTDQKRTKQQSNHPTHSIGNFADYSICEDGTYVDLRSELHATWAADNDVVDGAVQQTKYCNECKIHCPLCNICVLRKDHHCFLLGGCAGLANQRYFIVFLFWAFVGAIYGTTFNFAYLDKHVSPWFPFGWFFYLGPIAMVRWLIGYDSLFNAFLAVMFSMSVASAFATIGLFIFQMIYTLSGYTMYDFHRSGVRRIESDGDNYRERLALVFGRRWWLNFLFPQFWLPNQMNEKVARNIFLSTSKDL